MKHSCAVWLAVLFVIGAARADNWQQWRGPNNDGICHEKNLPTEWDAAKNVVWKLKLPGKGGATPAIWGDKIFLTSADGDDVVVLCASTDGKELWKRKLGKEFSARSGEGNGASPSPSVDG